MIRLDGFAHAGLELPDAILRLGAMPIPGRSLRLGDLTGHCLQLYLLLTYCRLSLQAHVCLSTRTHVELMMPSQQWLELLDDIAHVCLHCQSEGSMLHNICRCC